MKAENTDTAILQLLLVNLYAKASLEIWLNFKAWTVIIQNCTEFSEQEQKSREVQKKMSTSRLQPLDKSARPKKEMQWKAKP